MASPDEPPATSTAADCLNVKPGTPPAVEGRDAYQAQEALRTPNQQDKKGNSPHHIIVKIVKVQNF